MSIVGTPPAYHGRSSSISSRNRPGSKIGISTSFDRVSSAPRTPITHPAVWKRGIGISMPAPSGIPTRSPQSRALLTMLLWRSMTPLGNPVVPLVYWICAGSSGPTVGSVTSGPSVSSSSRSRRSTWRRQGSSARIASASAAPQRGRHGRAPRRRPHAVGRRRSRPPAAAAHCRRVSSARSSDPRSYSSVVCQGRIS
jgi:hypothetical protein